MKYFKGGQWISYEEQKQGLKAFKNGEWVDGFNNEDNPDISLYVYDGAKFIQKYPTQKVVRYTQIFKSSGLSLTHSKSGGAWDKNGRAIAGVWSSGAMYSSWLGLYFNSIYGGKGNVETIESVECTYTRRGIGNWEKGYKIPLVLSSLTSASGTGSQVQSSKRGSTIYSDTNMVTCNATDDLQNGTTTFTNIQAREVIREWLNSNTSLLLGYKETSGDYIGLNDISLKVTYTCNVIPAIFIVSDSEILSSTYSRKKYYHMYIYQNEIGKTYDEIIQHRTRHNIKNI